MAEPVAISWRIADWRDMAHWEYLRDLGWMVELEPGVWLDTGETLRRDACDCFDLVDLVPP